MATHEDVRRIVAKLPLVSEDPKGYTYTVLIKGKPKGLAWPWLERIHPKKARVPNLDVLAVRVANLTEKDIILGSDSVKFFTEDHYNGYPAVLVRLAEIPAGELEELLTSCYHSMV